MRCQVIKSFKRHGETQEIGSIIEVPDDKVLMLSSHVRQVEFCEARKVGRGICGGAIKTSSAGFLSCSDMRCQVPVKKV
jgi:hypothetical protein